MNTTDDGLLPCPFCSGDGESYLGSQSSFVKCENCGAEGQYCRTEAEAIAAWNTRTTPSLVTDNEVERCAREFYYEVQDISHENNGLRAPNWSSTGTEEREQLYRCIRAALAASDRDVLVKALEWIEVFAQIRSKDDSKVFARVNRGALRTIAERAGAALIGLPGEPK